jgi:hypothetical protein
MMSGEMSYYNAKKSVLGVMLHIATWLAKGMYNIIRHNRK